MLRIRRAHVQCRRASKAVDRAVLPGCEALRIFATNGHQWQGRPLDPEDVRRFRRRRGAGVRPREEFCVPVGNVGDAGPHANVFHRYAEFFSGSDPYITDEIDSSTKKP